MRSLQVVLLPRSLILCVKAVLHLQLVADRRLRFPLLSQLHRRLQTTHQDIIMVHSLHNYHTLHTYTNLYRRTMSVSWQNWRRGQSLMAHDRVKRQQQNRMFSLKLRLNKLTGGELRIFRGTAFHADLWGSVTESATTCWCVRLKVLVFEGGFLVNVGRGRADRYLVNYEDIQVVWWLRFYRWV